MMNVYSTVELHIAVSAKACSKSMKLWISVIS